MTNTHLLTGIVTMLHTFKDPYIGKGNNNTQSTFSIVMSFFVPTKRKELMEEVVVDILNWAQWYKI